MLVDDIADRIAIACPDEIDTIIKDMWVDHTHGRLTDNEAEVLDETARARKEAIQTYFDREVKPHVPDAWVNTAVRDPKDGQVGKVGYEINFNRYFYRFQPPRPLEEIEADLKALEKEIVTVLWEVAG